MTEKKKAFTEQLTADSLRVFSEAAKKSFSEQAQFFLNAFWQEFGSEAEFIYSVHSKVFRLTDMHSKGIQYYHLYEEGNDLDFDMGLYFFEKLSLYCDEPTHNFFNGSHGQGVASWYAKNPNFRTQYNRSLPTMMTALKRKQELREEVDVNFDGRVSMLEFLLYQFKASPKDLMDRSMGQMEEHPEITAAKKALMEVRKAVQAYEAEKQRLTDLKKEPGIKGLRAGHELAQLNAGPLWEQLNKALIIAEAKVRIAAKKFGGSAHMGDASQGNPMRTDGTIWWMQRELQEQQEMYGPKGRA